MRGNRCVHHLAALLLVMVYSESMVVFPRRTRRNVERQNHASGDR
jgi:hypothetical protein